MKDDLISRQAAIDALNEYFARIGKLKRRGLTKGEKAISLDTVGAIKTLPSAQPERKTGKWIEGNDSNRISGVCSVCGWESHLYEDDVAGMNFCPNCGAKMEGVKE